MRTFGTRMLATAAVLGVVLVASTASAALRSPQIPFNSASLQGYLNGQGESINVLTAQEDAQVWTSTVSGNSTFTLMLELAGNAANNALGIYNANEASPTLYQVFPGAALPGWFAIASFRSGGVLIVNLFDGGANLQSTSVFTGVNSQNFGYYLQGPNGTFYSQDSRNGGSAQSLVFAGTGRNSGSWWMSWEDLPPSSSDRDFNDAVLFLESVNPTPAAMKSWGALKARYR